MTENMDYRAIEEGRKQAIYDKHADVMARIKPLLLPQCGGIEGQVDQMIDRAARVLAHAGPEVPSEADFLHRIGQEMQYMQSFSRPFAPQRSSSGRAA